MKFAGISGSVVSVAERFHGRILHANTVVRQFLTLKLFSEVFVLM